MALKNKAWGVLFVLAMSCATRGAPPDEQHYFIYQGERVPLDVLDDQIAVFGDDEQHPLNLVGLEASGRHLRAERIHPAPGWRILELGLVGDRAHAMPIQRAVARVASANPAVFVSPVFQDQYGPLLINHDLLIGFHDDVRHDEAVRLVRDLGLGRITDRDLHGVRGLYRIRSGAPDGFAVLAQANLASAFPEVAFAEPDMVKTARLSEFFPDDPLFDSLWGIHNEGQFGGALPGFDMDGPQAWDISRGDPSIVVVVMDDGMDLAHPDLNSMGGFDPTGTTVNGSHDPLNPCDLHGTWVAGTIAARIDNGIGITGISPDCVVRPAKVFIQNTDPCTNTGAIASTWVTAAIQWAMDEGARVTNSSLFYGASGAVSAAFIQSRDAGLVHFASTGNDNFGAVTFPSSSPGVVAVGAADWSGDRASFSNWGTDLVLMGPGETIRSTSRGGFYQWVSGTSFASPYTAGVAALVLSRNSILTAPSVEQILIDSATDMDIPGWDIQTGWGLVNAHQALLLTPDESVPPPLALFEPAPMAANVSLRPFFDWEPSLLVHSFLLEVDDNSDFSSPEISIETTSANYDHIAPALPVSTTFWWRVIATNPLGSTISGPETFTTLSDPPEAFALLSPGDGEIDVSQMPTLSWNAAPLADDYSLIVATDAQLSNPIIQVDLSATAFEVVSPLEPLTTYFWAVVANNDVGSTSSTPVAAQFTTLIAPPAPFNLVAPLAQATIETRTPTFEWTSSVGADTYTLTLDDDGDFSSPVFVQSSIDSTSFQLPAGFLVDRTSYTWKIDAAGLGGSTLATFAPRSFFTTFPLCFGDADFSGHVNFSDITTTLGNWGANYGGGTGPGDADGNGVVAFSDVTTVLGNWLAVCP